jgi:hypothetical protein
MTRSIEISHEERVSRFALVPIDRKRLHGFKRRIAVDENSEECASAHLTRDGRFLLSASCTSALYVNEDGNTVNRNELTAVDAEGKLLPTLSATTDRPQAAEEVASLEDFLDHAVTKVYVLEAEALDPVLEIKLRAGAIFRIPYRPRPTTADTPTFLLANEHGVFLVQAEPCDFEYVGLEQTISETDDEWEDAEADGDEFGFELDWGADHAIA